MLSKLNQSKSNLEKLLNLNLTIYLPLNKSQITWKKYLAPLNL